MSTESKAPSRAGYWIAAAVALVGVIVGAAIVYSSIRSGLRELERFERIEVPGARTLSLPAGEHVLYFESQQGAPSASLIAARVSDADSGRPIPLQAYGSSFTYESAGRSGRAVHTFTTSAPGRYRIVASGAPAAGLSIALGPPLGGALVSRIFGAFGGVGLVLGGLLVGGIIALLTWLRRRRAKAGLASPAGPAPGPGGATPGSAEAPGPPGAPGPVAAPAPPAAGPPAGWYPDPGGQARVRWWDGSRWTDHTG